MDVNGNSRSCKDIHEIPFIVISYRYANAQLGHWLLVLATICQKDNNLLTVKLPPLLLKKKVGGFSSELINATWLSMIVDLVSTRHDLISFVLFPNFLLPLTNHNLDLQNNNTIL